MAITSFYLLNMFPQMRTLLSSPNNQHLTPRQNMFPRMRTLLSSPNNQHPTPRQNMFPQMRTSSSVNIRHPVLNPQTKHLL